MMKVIAFIIFAVVMLAIVLFIIYGPGYYDRYETRLYVEAYQRKKKLREQKKENKNKVSIHDFVEWKRQRDAMWNFFCALDERDRRRGER